MRKLPSSRTTKRRSFFVGDFETVLVNDVQYAYAAALMEVEPGTELTPEARNSVESFFCTEPKEGKTIADLS